MKSQARTPIGLFGGVTMLALAVVFGVGAGQSVSSATPTTPSEPPSPAVVAPASAQPEAGQPDVCIVGLNCGPVQPQPHR